MGIHYNKSLSRHILHRRLLGLAGRLLFLFPSYRVTIVVITIIIIAYCLGWEDFVLLRVSRGNKLEREREREERVDERRRTADGPKASPTLGRDTTHFPRAKTTEQTKRDKTKKKKKISASLW